ncbi:MAG TPA: hypothetical protein VKQ32_13010 [Polyangia bacterium]|nr:hypothetical protein [Polyangia bacterium]
MVASQALALVHVPLEQDWLAAHCWQAPPAVPQALAVFPGRHIPPAQQPVAQLVASQVVPSLKSIDTEARPFRCNVSVTGVELTAVTVAVTGPPAQVGTELAVTIAHELLKAEPVKVSLPTGRPPSVSVDAAPGITSDWRVTVRLPTTVTLMHETSDGTWTSARVAVPTSDRPSSPQAAVKASPPMNTNRVRRRI